VCVVERARWRAAVLVGVALSLAGCAGPTRSASTPLARDTNGRPTLAVTVDGKGPFAFVLDTAAERTFVQHRLADSLGLATAPLVRVNVQATGGNGVGRMLWARQLASALFSRGLEPVFELPNAGVTSADGILGMNVFEGARLALDFGAAAASVGPSGPMPAGWTGVRARIEKGDLVIVPVLVDGVKAEACVDTGARRTMGNLALARALGFGEGDARLVPTTPVTGASTDSVAAWTAPVGAITCASTRFTGAQVTFADAPVFARMMPGGGPALVLGIDQLRTLAGLAIDYGRGEVELKP